MLPTDQRFDNGGDPAAHEPIYIDRPPRIQPELPIDVVKIPTPPKRDEDGWMRLIQMALPMLMIVGYLVIMMGGGMGRSPLMILPMFLSIGAMSVFSIYLYFREKAKQEAEERAYEERLIELSHEMHAHHNQQQRFYHYNYPDFTTVLKIAREARYEAEKAERTLRMESRLWERRTDDDDFGVVRLGLGTLPSTVLYELGNEEEYDNPLMRKAKKLEDEAKNVSPIPVIISFRPLPTESDDKEKKEETQQAKEEEDKRTPETHALGVAGESEVAYAFTRSLLSHFAAFHAPQDARLFVVAPQKAPWAWVDELPHCQEEGGTTNYFHDEMGEAANEADKKPPLLANDDEDPLAAYLENIRKILSQRKLRMSESSDNESGGDQTLPHLMVVIDWLDAFSDPESVLSDLESDAAISILLGEGDKLGASIIFLVPERSKVPSSCTAVAEVEETTPASSNRYPEFQKAHFRYAETGLNSFRYVGVADVVKREDEALQFAQKLSELRVRESYGGALAMSVPFLEFMGFDSLRALTDAVPLYWEESEKAPSADWLRARVGAMSGNKPRTLVFSAKRDGVHGMVAGSTGSGKSELLISLISAMAVTYRPSVLNFVLVDYKGGGAFKAFEELPHCVDIITNLAGEGVTRMFTAINAELKRRQQLNTDTETKNIVEYRQKGLHLSHAPYPFLFIIIDEFAEMIADRAEYRAELETITRVGRAQGVSLILAAQRPSGVTDQMRSNIKFRISLRVETPAESREMLRRTDAAYLPGGVPGRGYLQVGNDEIELIQVAYCGDKYVDPTSRQMQPVLWPEREQIDNVVEDQEPPELYKAIIQELNRTAAQQGVPEQRAPWPAFLSPHLSLSDVLIGDSAYERRVALSPPGSGPQKPITSRRYLEDADLASILLGEGWESTLALNPFIPRWLNDEGKGWAEGLDWERFALRPVVGLSDDPYNAKQRPLTVNLPRGHAVIFGASGWGKTTFVRSLIVSLLASHSPNMVHAYLLDLGGRSLGALEEFPHVGAVISPDEEGYKERVEQLLRELEEVVRQRKITLGAAEMGDIYQYNARHRAAPMTAIVVAIDNFTEFRESFGGGVGDEESTLGRFIELARESRAYGVHFLITASQHNVLPPQLHNLFSERFTLRLNDSTEYRAIVGGMVSEIEEIPGRGYSKIGREALAFQVATVGGSDEEGSDTSQELRRLAQKMSAVVAAQPERYALPFSVGALPKAALYRHLLSRMHDTSFDEQFQAPLKALMRDQWAHSLEASEADWLKVTMALSPGDRLRTLELEAKKDGVHGLIAGGTGSGKSELLMTLIVDLAIHYDPSILNFVLVDYKGGGAFKPFEALPHCVQTITNLNKSAVERMFTSINAEMQRRQQLNAETGTKDIVEYREKGLHLSHAPYPHLFIIVDEYAEMISDNPEFKAELESITRVGRAQGVNLLLASQRPIGVTDQMRANIKLRICLRVEEVETSREMLRRNDAAFLPNGVPGRGYLQVGNEGVELVQVAYTGESYANQELATESGRDPKFYDIVVALAQQLLVDAALEAPAAPWPPFLPTALAMDSPLANRAEGDGKAVVVHPALAAWADGRGRWPTVDWQRHAMRGIVGIVDDPWNAAQYPMVVDVKKGHAALFGASGYGKSTFLRALILGLAGSHSPNEFQAHILDLGGRTLEVLRALPHVGTVVMPDERGYEERVQQLWREMNDLIETRKRLFTEAGVSTLYEYNRSGQPVEPALLIAIDNFGEYIETFGNQTAEDSPMEVLTTLMRQSRAYGIHFVITTTRPNVLSSKLYSLFTERMTLRLASQDDYMLVVGGRVSGIEETAGRGYLRVKQGPLAFQVALPPGTVSVDSQGNVEVANEAAQIRAIGERMTAYIARSDQRYAEPLRIDALPNASSYRVVLGDELGIDVNGSYVGALQRAIAERWALNHTAERADWLRVPLGITSGNRIRTLELEAKKDGVHGMIAGGTGSGKSELLITMLVGLAAYYPPDILNFVLVDYKGGGAFRAFESLPHCVDIVTNLNKSAVERMFTAINAEIRRRQGLNADTNTKDIVDYRRKGLHLNGGQPYPHLFIIIDEYAEMIDDNPEYRSELESITRVGRAQGVNLILASQRPKGVTDQMRANIKLKLCLRVEQPDTSVELLRRPDAARLPNGQPGRGYLVVGNDNLELVQVSYSGESQPDDRPDAVLWPDHEAVETSGGETPTFYDLVVQLASELVDHQPAPKPWPEFLPLQLTLQSPIYNPQNHTTSYLNPAISDWLNGEWAMLWPGADWGGKAMHANAGLLDDPVEAWQGPLTVDLARNHLAIYGDAGWGRSSLMRTVMVDLMSRHGPDELHIYVLDLGGRGSLVLEAFPHVGAVIFADEDSFEERLNRLLARLEGMVSQRQQLFSEAGVQGLHSYNQQHPDERLPAVLLAIDNFELLRESYEMLIENTILPLVRRASSVGITVMISATTPNSLTRKLSSLFGTALTFRQNNADNYLDIVGRGALELDEIPGRGYIRVGRRPLLFQAALPVGLPDAATGRDKLSESRELRRMAAMMQRAVAASRRRARHLPMPIDILPEQLPLARLLEAADEPHPRRVEALIGKTGALETAHFDLQRMMPHFMVIGPPLSGKTTVLYNWIFSLASRHSPEQVSMMLVDFQRRFVDYNGERTLAELPHVLAIISETEEWEAIMPQFRATCQAIAEGDGSRQLFVFIDNFSDASDELERSSRDLVSELSTIIRRYGRDGIHFVIADGVGSNTGELRRRIASANFGLGLRISQSLDALRVMRTPAGFRDKELNVGRGYVVRSGQASLLQAASPYDVIPFSDDVDEDERRAQALDWWVAQICERYDGQRATWLSTGGGAGPNGSAPSATNGASASEQAMRDLALIQKAMQREVWHLQNGDELEARLVPAMSAVAPQTLYHEEVLLSLLREAWRQDKLLQGWEESLADLLINDMDYASLVIDLETGLASWQPPEPSTNGG